ncbi:DNA cytosine methyltransferase [Arcobacter sp. F2176]|uniref:DNA cytosine methyltransferase n=2 Tax=Arcobacteraceae TaxID=2808963 RepID=UPI0013E97B63|nr:DNA cytosine methyltransferase [Arcobacter sp. F2176]
MNYLTLSIFSGLDLLGQAFQNNGFCVVSAGDIQWGKDIRQFKPIKNIFGGVVGGPPCQDFSGLNRNPKNYSLEMLQEFKRIVLESSCDWALLENVKGVPDLDIEGYYHQRIDINQGWYSDTSRLRHIQFYCKKEFYLNIPRGQMKNINNTCALASDNRSYKELLKLQGLPQDFNLDSFTLKGKKKLVGNAVPFVIGDVLAKEVKRVMINFYKECDTTVQINKSDLAAQQNIVTDPDIKIYVTDRSRFCACGCKRVLTGNKKYYDFSCRKRAERKRKREKKVSPLAGLTRGSKWDI